MNWTKVGQKISNFFDLVSTFNRWKEAIKDLNTTNAQIVAGIGMGILTGLVYFATQIVKMILAFKFGGIEGWEAPKLIHLDVFSAWLLFVASWIGFSIRQFRHKRETFMGEDGKGESVRHAEARNGSKNV